MNNAPVIENDTGYKIPDPGSCVLDLVLNPSFLRRTATIVWQRCNVFDHRNLDTALRK